MRKAVFIVILFLSFIITPLSPSPAFAQTPPASNNTQSVEGTATLGVANMVSVASKDVQDGNVLSTSQKGAVLSTVPYDPQVLGIVARDAGILLSNSDDPNGVPVISDGTVY